MRKPTGKTLDYSNLHGVERQRAKCRAYHAAHRERENARRKKYHQEHREQHKQNMHKWYQENKDSEQIRNRKKYAELTPEQKEHRRLRAREYRLAHVEQEKLRHTIIRQRTKEKAMELVAKGKPVQCVYCGCDYPQFLEINHKNGGGRQETKADNRVIYDRIVHSKRDTDDLEIACKVCNIHHYIKLKNPEMAKNFTVIWKSN